MSTSPTPFPQNSRGVRWSRDLLASDRRSSGNGTGSWRGDDVNDLTGRSDRFGASRSGSRPGSGLSTRLSIPGSASSVTSRMSNLSGDEDDSNKNSNNNDQDDDDDDEDDAPPPMMQLNPLTRALLDQKHGSGPDPDRDHAYRPDSRTHRRSDVSLDPAHDQGQPADSHPRPDVRTGSALQDEQDREYRPAWAHESRPRAYQRAPYDAPEQTGQPPQDRYGTRLSGTISDDPEHDPDFETEARFRQLSRTRSNVGSRTSSHSEHLVPPEVRPVSGAGPVVPSPDTPERRNHLTESTPAMAPSARIKRAGLLGAPARRLRAAVDDDEVDDEDRIDEEPDMDGPPRPPIPAAPEFDLRPRIRTSGGGADVGSEVEMELEREREHDYDYDTDPNRRYGYPGSADRRHHQVAAYDQENVPARLAAQPEPDRDWDREYDGERDRQREYDGEWDRHRNRPLSSRTTNPLGRLDEAEQAAAAAAKRKPALASAPAPAPAPPPTRATPGRSDGHRNRRRRTHFTINGKQYAQLWRLGKGGSADVFQVMSESGQSYALKRVRLDKADETAMAGFRGEIELLRALRDVDRVVDLFDWQVDEAKQCLSVLLEPGDVDLGSIIGNKAVLDMPFVRYYWREMLECVYAVHKHDIVHSDLKPANFVLVDGVLKLIDFGIAGAIDMDHTVHVHRDAHVGTPNYMSPESLTDSNSRRQPGVNGPGRASSSSSSSKLMKVGKPADVWSLGCILYQLVYGRAPFAHIVNPLSRVMTIMRRDEEVRYPAVGVGDGPVPAVVIRTIRRCLSWEPGVRPTVSALLDRTDPFLFPESSQNNSDPSSSASSTATTANGGVVVKPDEVVMSRDLLAQIIGRLAARFGDPNKEMPTEDEVKGYPAVFFNRIKEYQVKEDRLRAAAAAGSGAGSGSGGSVGSRR